MTAEGGPRIPTTRKGFPMPEPMKAYRCKYRCGKIGTQKARIAEHEEWCFRNPQSRSCFTCDSMSGVECLKLGIDFQTRFRLQTRCMYYDNTVVGINGVSAPAEVPKPNRYISPHRQFETGATDASHD